MAENNPGRYHASIYLEVDNRERQLISHKLYRDNFQLILNRVLDEYGLANRLSQLSRKAKVLDAGCGLGFYLQDVAAVMEKRGYLERVDFYGADLDLTAVLAATDIAKAAHPPRPYLNFYLHDLTRPLSECQGLFLDGQFEFDFIYATGVTEYIPHAFEVVQELYNRLAPGGVIYLRSMVLEKGDHAWQAPHAGIDIFAEFYFQSLLSLNNGVMVATEQAKWLEQLGATQTLLLPDKRVTGGETELGITFIRNFMALAYVLGPTMIKKGLLTQTEFNKLIDDFYRELGPHCIGQTLIMDVLAKKA